ncbi:MAG: hypothetical protein FJ161_02855 [Gammaproteobacteria bacterium]|nr:hypothetical protein [Gammaproteobacteria bacterium]
MSINNADRAILLNSGEYLPGHISILSKNPLWVLEHEGKEIVDEALQNNFIKSVKHLNNPETYTTIKGSVKGIEKLEAAVKYQYVPYLLNHNVITGSAQPEHPIQGILYLVEIAWKSPEVFDEYPKVREYVATHLAEVLNKLNLENSTDCALYYLLQKSALRLPVEMQKVLQGYLYENFKQHSDLMLFGQRVFENYKITEDDGKVSNKAPQKDSLITLGGDIGEQSLEYLVRNAGRIIKATNIETAPIIMAANIAADPIKLSDIKKENSQNKDDTSSFNINYAQTGIAIAVTGLGLGLLVMFSPGAPLAPGVMLLGASIGLTVAMYPAIRRTIYKFTNADANQTSFGSELLSILSSAVICAGLTVGLGIGLGLMPILAGAAVISAGLLLGAGAVFAVGKAFISSKMEEKNGASLNLFRGSGAPLDRVLCDTQLAENHSNVPCSPINPSSLINPAKNTTDLKPGEKI